MEPKSGNAALLRRINRGIVLEALKKADTATVAQLSRQTGLSLATCATIAEDLVKLGQALQLEEKSSVGGRPARHFRFNPNHTLLALCMAQMTRAGGEVLRTFLVNAMGAVQASAAKSLKRITPAHIVTALQKLRAAHPQLRAAVLAVPGVVRGGAVAICDAPGLADTRPAAQIWTHVGIPAAVENDMNLAALGYARKWRESEAGGASGGAGMAFAYMTVPAAEPLGAGLVVNGMIHKGKSEFAGEVSFAIPEDRMRLDGRWPSGREERLAIVVKGLLILTTTLNPETVILTGDGMEPGMLPEVLAACREAVPEEHLPDLRLNADAEGDIREGMLELGLGLLRPEAGEE